MKKLTTSSSKASTSTTLPKISDLEDESNGLLPKNYKLLKNDLRSTSNKHPAL